jgi:hypothetical protein
MSGRLPRLPCTSPLSDHKTTTPKRHFSQKPQEKHAFCHNEKIAQKSGRLKPAAHFDP